MQKKSIAAVLTLTAALTLSISPTQATENQSELDLANKVMNSQDPEETYGSLSSSEKARFVEAMNPAEVAQSSSKPVVISTFKSGNCKQASHHQDWKSNFGFTVATSWLDIEWCTNGNQVSDIKITNQGGETRTPGYSYQGVKNSGAKADGNVGRAYSEIGLRLWDGIDFAHQLPALTPCIKLTGHANGRSEAMADIGAGNGCRSI